MAVVTSVTLNADKTQVYVGETVNFSGEINVSGISYMDPNLYVIWVNAIIGNTVVWSNRIPLQLGVTVYQYNFSLSFPYPGTYTIFVDAFIGPKV